jgi:hypothetical protein
LKKRELGPSSKEKHVLVGETIALIGTSFKDLCFKHDGCRILQALLKHGTKEQRSVIVENIKDQFIYLMSNKYSHYLASKAFLYAPDLKQKQYFRALVNKEINKHILHLVSNSVIYIYSMFSMPQKSLNTSTLNQTSLSKEKWFSLSMETSSTS